MSEIPTEAKIIIELNEQFPDKSIGWLKRTNADPYSFKVGSGRLGILPEGSRFKDGYSLLGQFRVSGILTAQHFSMLPQLIASSGQTEAYLKTELFKNMSSIDFDDDGKIAEYGVAYIGLTPLDAAPQPFGFNEFRGKFRWYNFAIHGTNDEKRIGKMSTGGCINVGENALIEILAEIQLNDLVLVKSINGEDSQ